MPRGRTRLAAQAASRAIGQKARKCCSLLLAPTKPNGALVARVDKNQPGELIQLRYVDQWKNNPQTPHNWNSALETYRFIPISQGTKLSCTLEVDNNEACIAFFDQAWPAALQRLKDLCEQQ